MYYFITENTGTSNSTRNKFFAEIPASAGMTNQENMKII
jgi:hypothetical protein